MGVQAGAGTEHRYQLCRDEYCDKFLCRVYKEGYRNGHEDGRQRGFGEGYAAGCNDGYGAGFPAGLASCPGPHG